ncbi:MAG: 2-isopropylmalate synthase [Actinomycetota bacterium]|jgi:2-isopropylmalate synthase|nr:2-isopropylmalate synthase [Actinomycetota bacterium]
MESDMEEKREKIYIFDTTLRDGEQAPGIHLNTKEKLEIARQLEKLNVDVIEAGFPISSKSDFNSVREISKEIKGRKIAALARANFKDIDAAGEALKEAEQPVIHTFISSSDIHLKYQLKKSREEVLGLAGEAVKRSRNYTDIVEFSAMDATRSDWEYLCRLYETAIKNGATIINVPDTVGYALPDEFGEMIDYIFENTAGIENVVVSVHCHNDLGLAVANSLAAIKHGARQVECAVNGIGERAGNASLEEIVMIIDTRKNSLGMYTDINTKEIIRTSSIVRSLTGYLVAPNKAIVGKNAFSHEAGIHQDGMLKDRSTYEIIRPEDIGLKSSKLVLGKHSGRHAFVGKLNELGIHLSEENLEKAFERFKDLAERKGTINDEDIKAIAEDEIREVTEHFLLKYYRIQSGSDINAEATVGIEINGKLHESSSTGNGPVDASFKAIDKIVNINTKLIEYSIEAVSGGKDALGSVKVVVSTNGVEVMGSGISTDIVEASIKAYIDAMNRIVENKD